MLGLPVYDTQCGAKVFRVTPATAELFSRPFQARWIFDVEILARMTTAAIANNERQAVEQIYEYPLETWTDVAGTRLRSIDFLIAAVDLLRIYSRYRRRPTPNKRQGGALGLMFASCRGNNPRQREGWSTFGLPSFSSRVIIDGSRSLRRTASGRTNALVVPRRRHIVWELVRRYAEVEPGRRLKICELGCGTGGNLVSVADRHDVVGVECSRAALAYARQSLGDRVQYGALPDRVDLPRESFDVVLLTDVLEHIADDRSSANTALELLRPGGIIVATVPAYQWLYSPRDAHHHHFRRYGKRQFAALWQHPESQTLFLSHYNSLLFPFAAAVRLLSKLRTADRRSGDLSIPNRGINDLLARMMRSEANLLGRIPLAFGLSLIGVIRKTNAATVAETRQAA